MPSPKCGPHPHQNPSTKMQPKGFAVPSVTPNWECRQGCLGKMREKLLEQIQYQSQRIEQFTSIIKQCMEQADSDPVEPKKPESEASASPNYSTKRQPEVPEANIYYREFSKLYLANLILNTHLKELNQEKQELLARLSKVEVADAPSQRKSEDVDGSLNEEKRKRVRRTASEIHRHYKCMVDNCQKSYGSEGSLNQHIKLKHPELALLQPHASLPYSVSEKEEVDHSSNRP